MINPLGEDLAVLKDVDGDYDVSTYGGDIDLPDGHNGILPNMTAMEKSSPAEATTLVQTHLD